MERSRLRNGSAGGAAGFPEGLAKAASEGGATKRWISDAGDAALPWKKMPSRTFVAREKSVPQRTGCLSRQGPVPLVTLSGSRCSFAILKILRSPRVLLTLLCLGSVNGTTKPGWRHVCLQHGLPSIFSPLLTPAAQKVLFKTLLLTGSHLVTHELRWRRTRDGCRLRACGHSLHPAAHGPRSNFSF